jgi:hypothetical protein
VIEYYQHALAISQHISDRRAEVNQMGNLGNAYTDLAQVERTLLRVLSFHVGRQNVIGRPGLLAQLNRSGFDIDDRQLRLQINLLRKRGILICSAGGRNGGYWIAANHDEIDKFLNHEVRARIADLSEQDRAMSTSAREAFGVKQFHMF